MKRLYAEAVFCLMMMVSTLVVAQGIGMQQGRGMGHNLPTFTEYDLDKSGFLDEDEFIEARGMRVSERAKQGRMMRGLSSMMQFSDIDLNVDGKVTPDEFSQGLALHNKKKMQQ